MKLQNFNEYAPKDTVKQSAMPSGRLGRGESPLFFLHLELLFDFSIRSVRDGQCRSSQSFTEACDKIRSTLTNISLMLILERLRINASLTPSREGGRSRVIQPGSYV